MSLKSFSHNTIIYSVGTIALRFTSFLLIPLYTQYLTKSDFGLLQTLLFTIQIILTINEFGMRTALMRFFPDYENSHMIDKLLGSSIFLNIITGSTLVTFALFIPDSFLSDIFHIDIIPNIVLVTVLVGVTQSLNRGILSYFRAKDQSIPFMMFSLISSILTIAAIYIFLVELNLGVIGVLWAQIIIATIMWLIILSWIIYRHGISLDTSILKSLIRFGFPLIFAMSGDLIINTWGNFLLGYFRSLDDVAIYSLAFKIASISIMVLIGPFQMAYEPYIFKNKNSKDLETIIPKVTTYILFAFIVISFGILYLSKDLIQYLGEGNYVKSYYLIFWILPGICFISLSYIGQSLLHIKNKTRITGLTIFFVTLISLLVSYFSINLYGLSGLVFSINFYLIVSAVALFYFGYKEIRIKLEFNRILQLLFLGLILFLTTYFLGFFNF
ncbi:MAG: oligosaccharide flippase family protein, partial [Melioribacteraceae bacterium]|nr:oligosaccharide flippase family protein [Melioribacteraceae bacterium]